MIKKESVTQEDFELLLNWLDRNRENAGRKYEKIRQRLIRIFAGRGCYEAEDLADETINRVTRKLSAIIHEYVGEPSLYFYSVARNVHHEWLRRQGKMTETDFDRLQNPENNDQDAEFDCLENCLKKIPTNQAELILSYYCEDKRAKIEHRRMMAEKLGLKPGALQIRLHRIRAELRRCVDRCVAGKK